jgi:hypothetical protein
MWSFIQNSNPIWYFDATGSIHKSINGQKMPFLYSMVVHDKINKSIVPVFEFITTSQTITSISKYLMFARDLINKNMSSYWGEGKSRLFLAPIIVTDFSWALINSIHNVFNGFSVLSYLQRCFNSLVNKSKNEKIVVRHYLCATHFLKMLIKHLPVDINKRVKKTFLIAFTLLQSSSSIEEFDDVLHHIYTVFNSPYKTASTINSLDYLRVAIFKRNLTNTDISGTNTVFQKEREEELKNTGFLTCDEISSESSLKKNSPFYFYYKRQIDLMKYNLSLSDNVPTIDANIYYKPELFDIINNYLYFMPCWSGAMISDYREKTVDTEKKIINNQIKRLTNNPVENHIGFTKVNLLGNKLFGTSHFVSVQYKRIESKFFSFYETAGINVSIKVTPKIYNNKELFEVWKNKEIIKARKKGFYYQNFQHFDSDVKIINNIDSIYNNFKTPEEFHSFFTYNHEMDDDQNEQSEDLKQIFSTPLDALTDQAWITCKMA